MQRITIDPLTRLEGHGKIEIFLDEAGDVANAYLQVPELRGFERFCVAGELSLIQLMVRYGADSRLCSRDGWSPVHMATWSGRPEVMLYVMDCSKRC